tara:strand:+ start:194 stop:424 length:231 start_codon:yes stop_codon:yes gene_type:complete
MTSPNIYSPVDMTIDLAGCEINEMRERRYEAEMKKVRVECVICNTQTSNELDYDYDDDTGFHCCLKTDCLREFYRE